MEPCIRAGTSERGVCAACAAPWRRVVEASTGGGESAFRHGGYLNQHGPQDNSIANATKSAQGPYHRGSDTGWAPTCEHDVPTVPATILDPFAGSGTVASVAQRLGRRGIGVELNAEYLALAQKRIERTQPALALGGRQL